MWFRLHFCNYPRAAAWALLACAFCSTFVQMKTCTLWKSPVENVGLVMSCGTWKMSPIWPDLYFNLTVTSSRFRPAMRMPAAISFSVLQNLIKVGKSTIKTASMLPSVFICFHLFQHILRSCRIRRCQSACSLTIHTLLSESYQGIRIAKKMQKAF